MYSPDRFDKGREQYSNSKETLKTLPTEEQSNFKGNYSELLFSRMKNPVIRGQLLDMLEANEKWMAQHPEDVSEMKKDPHTGEILLDDLSMPIFEKVPGVYTPKTREQMNKEIEDALTAEMSQPSIDFSKSLHESFNTTNSNEKDEEDPTNRTAVIGMRREGGSPLSEDDVRERSVIEAHEKGHVFRKLKSSQYLHDRFSRAFDLSSINLDTYSSEGKPEGVPDDKIREYISRYFDLSDPHELIERMAQLKGYFGMKGEEVFTPQHLEYVREHYLKDGMDDNHMKSFFEAITPKTEFAFLKLMNSSGI